MNEVLCEIRGAVGFITLNRPQALNALTLTMIRALTGTRVGAAEALQLGLADHCLDAGRLPQAWDALADIDPLNTDQMAAWVAEFSGLDAAAEPLDHSRINAFFSLDSVGAMVQALEADASDWARRVLKR